MALGISWGNQDIERRRKVCEVSRYKTHPGGKWGKVSPKLNNFHERKTFSMVLSRKLLPPQHLPLFMNNIMLPKTDSHKHLVFIKVLNVVQSYPGNRIESIGYG